LEVAALVVLLIGGVVVPLIGWIAGVVLLWISDAWTNREKLLGTLVVPGGLMVPALLLLLPGRVCGQVVHDGVVRTIGCTGPAGVAQAALIAAFAVSVIAPIATVVFLATRARRRPSPVAAVLR
jgi:hypothetical protein